MCLALTLSHSCSLLCSTLYKKFFFFLLFVIVFILYFLLCQPYFTLYNKKKNTNILYRFYFYNVIDPTFFLKSHNKIKNKINNKQNTAFVFFSEEIHNKYMCLYKMKSFVHCILDIL